MWAVKVNGLTPKQARFVAEYLIDLNATQAAIRAGYSDKNAEQSGSQLFRNIQVRAAIDAALAKRSGKLEITAEKVLRDLEELRGLAIADKQYSPAARAIELHGKHLGMFGDRNENHTTLTLVDAVDRPERETREQWVIRRSKELGIDPRLMGATAGAAD